MSGSALSPRDYTRCYHAASEQPSSFFVGCRWLPGCRHMADAAAEADELGAANRERASPGRTSHGGLRASLSGCNPDGTPALNRQHSLEAMRAACSPAGPSQHVQQGRAGAPPAAGAPGGTRPAKRLFAASAEPDPQAAELPPTAASSGRAGGGRPNVVRAAVASTVLVATTLLLAVTGGPGVFVLRTPAKLRKRCGPIAGRDCEYAPG